MNRGFSALALLAVMGSMTGCLGTGTEPVAGAKAETEGKADAGAPAAFAFRNAYLSAYFAGHQEVQSDGGAGVEKFVDCGINSVLVGWGGRVDGDGNFTDIRIGCREITYDGLGPVTKHPGSATPAEKYVEADPGHVVVGVGGIVDNENLTRAVIRQCPWNPNAMEVDPAMCTFKNSGGGNTTERFLDIHDYVDPSMRHLTVLTGMGATAGYEALKVVRVTRGTLKVQAMNRSNLSGGQLYFYFTVPPGGSNVKISIAEPHGVGDADLYVGKGFMPDLTNYTCRPYLVGNNEACYFAEPGEYQILINPRSPFWYLSLHAEYTK